MAIRRRKTKKTTTTTTKPPSKRPQLKGPIERERERQQKKRTFDFISEKYRKERKK